MQVTVILLIAGSGRRLGTSIPKQYIKIGDDPLLIHCLKHLAQSAQVRFVQPVIAADDTYYHGAIAKHHFPFTLLDAVIGGKERVDSMQAGLAAIPKKHAWVAVHDAARPLVQGAMLASLFQAAWQHGAAAPALHVVDTIKQVNAQGFVVNTPPRHHLRAVQTPQVARRAWFEHALQHLAGRLDQVTDDMSLLELAGYPVFLSEGDLDNRKITWPEDLQWLQQKILKT